MAAFAFVPLGLPRDNRLDARAIRLLQTAGWRRLYGNPDYFWEETGELIYFQPAGADRVAAVEQRILPQPFRLFPPVRRAPVLAKRSDAIYDVSPDGQWMTAFSQDGQYRIRSIANGARKPDVSMKGNYGFWARDSRAAICFDWTFDPAHSLNMKAWGARYSVDGRKPEMFDLPRDVSNHAWSDGVLGVLPGDRVLLMRDSELGRVNQPLWQDFSFAIADLRNPTSTPRIWTVTPQHNTIGARVTLSNSGDRLIWVQEQEYVSPFDRLLQRLMPGRQPKSSYKITWSISRVDGSDIREVACYDTHDAAELDQTSLWPVLTPDNQYLSFIKNGWLCVVPVD